MEVNKIASAQVGHVPTPHNAPRSPLTAVEQQRTAQTAQPVQQSAPEQRVNVSTQPAPEQSGVQAARAEQTEAEVADVTIARAVDNANRILAQTGFRLSYGVHEATNIITVRIYDVETEEVIRELPPESRLDTLAKILEMTGMIFDDGR